MTTDNVGVGRMTLIEKLVRQNDAMHRALTAIAILDGTNRTWGDAVAIANRALNNVMEIERKSEELERKAKEAK